MKKSEIIFSSILVPIDYIVLILAGLSAYFLRYSGIYTTHIREVVFSLAFPIYFKFVCLIAVLWIIIFAISGLYSMRFSPKVFDLLNKIFLACSTSTLVILVIFFFSRELFSSRFIILAVWILSIFYISIVHLLIRFIQKLFYKKGIGVHKVILVGDNDIGNEILKEFKRNFKLGYKVVYQVKSYGDELENKVKELVVKNNIDEIIQTDPNFSREQILKLINLANEYHLDFKYTADLLGARRTNVDIQAINGIPILEIKKTPLDGWGRVVKRIIDIFGSILFLILFLPVFLIIPILIKLDSPGKIIYKTQRVGAKDRKFYLYKFRSMIPGADKKKEELKNQNERSDGPLFKIENDPRITHIGKFLRRTSLDEFPNFWNVLIGNMSLVGPRPHEPGEVSKYKKHHKKLLNIKPGITGLAQISGRSTLDFETEVKLDTLYIETWSLQLDFIILFKTPFIVLFSKTAV